MHTDERNFLVVLVGFDSRETSMLNQLCRLSQVRQRRYAVWDSHASTPDLLLVNGDATDAVPDLPKLRKQHGGLPCLWIRSGEGTSPTPATTFQRPMIMTRLLQALDRLVTEHYAYVPELKIQDSSLDPPPKNLRWNPVCVPVGETPRCRGKRILVVDDSESARSLMHANLSPCAFVIDQADNGQAALGFLSRQTYDLIFLDVILPDVLGFEVCRRIKKELRLTTPVVLLTGQTSRIDKVRGILASADMYLTKPLSHDDLLECLHRYFPLS